ncbi:MAG: ATP-binding protein [Paracoccaceae bacterium]
MSDIDFETLWSAIPYPAYLIDKQGKILCANTAAEVFGATSLRLMKGQNLSGYIGKDSPVLGVISQARQGAMSVALNGVTIVWGGQAPRLNNLHAANMGDSVLLLLHPRNIAEKMDRSLTHQSAARSVSGMAAMLAHEIRNPLAGISGAAQLLEMELTPQDQKLTTLIQDETQRISKLVERMEQFGDLRPAQNKPVNIHDVLDRAKRAAMAGFARHVRFLEHYDPSLPPVSGDRDQLLQVFQNLIKNASEAVAPKGGVITLKTAFRQGVRLQMSGQDTESLPLEVSISDNGPGISQNIIHEIFEPFVSTKAAGTGLGLSLVSKIIADHGGIIECESCDGKTRFKVLLPIWRASKIKGKT